MNLLKEEKEFVSKEIKNSKQYNAYLKKKLKDLEDSQNDTKIKNEASFENTSRIIKTSMSPSPAKNKEKETEKLENFFRKNEEILLQRINHEERQIKDKYNKYKQMESFKNSIFQILNNKIKDYQFTLMNSKVSNQEVFFNIPEHDLSSKTTKKVSIGWDKK
jgi:hypothetical protein